MIPGLTSSFKSSTQLNSPHLLTRSLTRFDEPHAREGEPSGLVVGTLPWARPFALEVDTRQEKHEHEDRLRPDEDVRVWTYLITQAHNADEARLRAGIDGLRRERDSR
jgi:hypothetical protein